MLRILKDEYISITCSSDEVNLGAVLPVRYKDIRSIRRSHAHPLRSTISSPWSKEEHRLMKKFSIV